MNFGCAYAAFFFPDKIPPVRRLLELSAVSYGVSFGLIRITL